jgi:hypothetical protein
MPEKTLGRKIATPAMPPDLAEGGHRRAARPQPRTADAPAPAEVPCATVRFGPGYRQSVQGLLVGGGMLSLEYDPGRARLTHTHHGLPAWGVQAYVKFLPGGQVMEAPAIAFDSYMGRTTHQPLARPVSLEIPEGARQVQVWFKNWTAADSPRESWDSNFGSNYTFDVAQ